MTTAPLSASGRNPIYVDVVFWQLYILAPCCIVYVVDLAAECYCLHIDLLVNNE